MWRIASRRAGVNGFTPNDLHQFAALVLIEQGPSVKAVQTFLGHAKASMTLDTYAHRWPSSDDQVRTALDRVLGAAVSPVCHSEQAEVADLR
jgi:integrase